MALPAELDHDLICKAIRTLGIAIVLAILASVAYAGPSACPSGGPYGGDVKALAINPTTHATVFTNSAGSATTTGATLAVSIQASAPVITEHPSNKSVPAGVTVSFSAAATGSPAPTVQWQARRGDTFSDISGATGTTYSETATSTNNGVQFRAVFTNSAGTATTFAATLTVTAPNMAIDKNTLYFAAVTTGAAFTSQTPAQLVRLTQSGPGVVTWTAEPTEPWLVVSPISGSGPATLTISTRVNSGLTDAQTGNVRINLTGFNPIAGIFVSLTTVSSTAPASPPFGNFDTPAGDATVLSGSVAVTGWTLDNIGVKQVELWREVQPGETTPPGNSTPGDLRNGKIFIANATFVDGARPDVAKNYLTTPARSRAGWGYLMLTWGLFGQGNGTYRLYAFGVDEEGNTATIGTKSLVISNNTATKPFGAIDTPGNGGDASGPNFGWALTPKVNGAATCKIQPSGVQVSIDSGPLQPVLYGDARTDVASAFTGFSNTAAAGGHFIFDWSTLTNGLHTIGWLITDDCNRADGVGSRFFNVTTGTALRAAQTAIAEPPSLFAASRISETESEHPITVARGYGELPEIVGPTTGPRTIRMKPGERIEIRVPRGFESAYQLDPNGERLAMPIGSTWDGASQTFFWQPAPGFLGSFRLVFTTGSERISVRVIVMP